LNMSVSGVRMTAMVGECVEDEGVEGARRRENRGADRVGMRGRPTGAAGFRQRRQPVHLPPHHVFAIPMQKRDGVPPRCSMLYRRS
jgi:hypothetical protein